MDSNGILFQFSSFGESHGEGIGGIMKWYAIWHNY